MRLFAGLWVLVTGIFSVLSLFNGHFIAFLVLGALAIPGVIFSKNFDAKEKDAVEALKRKVLAACGTTSRYTHFEDKTAVALNEEKREIVLANSAGIVKSYPFASVRDWSVKEETAGQTGYIAGGTDGAAIAQGLAIGVAAGNANVKALQQARANTGLFINIKDVDHPEWRVSMQSKDDRNRWFEILNQALNEGGVA